MDAGVRSLKIEGRMKDAAYVAVTYVPIASILI